MPDIDIDAPTLPAERWTIGRSTFVVAPNECKIVPAGKDELAVKIPLLRGDVAPEADIVEQAADDARGAEFHVSGRTLEVRMRKTHNDKPTSVDDFLYWIRRFFRKALAITEARQAVTAGIHGT